MRYAITTLATCDTAVLFQAIEGKWSDYGGCFPLNRDVWGSPGLGKAIMRRRSLAMYGVPWVNEDYPQRLDDGRQRNDTQ